jgi:integrase
MHMERCRKPTWAEFNLGAAEPMKMREHHVVPLSRQVVELLRELQAVFRRSEFLFPAPDDAVLGGLFAAAVGREGWGRVEAACNSGVARLVSGQDVRSSPEWRSYMR